MQAAGASLETCGVELEFLGQSEDLMMPEFLPPLPKSRRKRIEALIERELKKFVAEAKKRHAARHRTVSQEDVVETNRLTPSPDDDSVVACRGDRHTIRPSPDALEAPPIGAAESSWEKVMPRQSVENRLERFEQRVTAIEELPARMDRLESQIVQLRAEMRDGFTAIRQEIQTGDEGVQRSLREEIRAGNEETCRSLREEIRAGVEETRRVLREEIRAGDEETRRVLREEMRTGHVMIVTTLTELVEDSRRQTHVLFEELVSRIATLQGQSGRTRPKKKR